VSCPELAEGSLSKGTQAELAHSKCFHHSITTLNYGNRKPFSARSSSWLERSEEYRGANDIAAGFASVSLRTLKGAATLCFWTTAVAADFSLRFFAHPEGTAHSMIGISLLGADQVRAHEHSWRDISRAWEPDLLDGVDWSFVGARPAGGGGLIGHGSLTRWRKIDRAWEPDLLEGMD
jgi:hypothetical protein